MEGGGSSSVLIRAPVTSLDDATATPPLSDEEEFFLSGDEEDGAEFEAAAASPPTAARLEHSTSMPKAPVTDDDAGDLFGAAIAEYEAEFSSPEREASRVAGEKAVLAVPLNSEVEDGELGVRTSKIDAEDMIPAVLEKSSVTDGPGIDLLREKAEASLLDELKGGELKVDASQIDGDNAILAASVKNSAVDVPGIDLSSEKTTTSLPVEPESDEFPVLASQFDGENIIPAAPAENLIKNMDSSLLGKPEGEEFQVEHLMIDGENTIPAVPRKNSDVASQIDPSSNIPDSSLPGLKVEASQVDDENVIPATTAKNSDVEAPQIDISDKIAESTLPDRLEGEESKVEASGVDDEWTIAASLSKNISDELPSKVIESSLPGKPEGEELQAEASQIVSVTKEINIEDKPATPAATAKFIESPFTDVREEVSPRKEIKVESEPLTSALPSKLEVKELPLKDSQTVKEIKLEDEPAIPPGEKVKESQAQEEPSPVAPPQVLQEVDSLQVNISNDELISPAEKSLVDGGTLTASADPSSPSAEEELAALAEEELAALIVGGDPVEKPNSAEKSLEVPVLKTSEENIDVTLEDEVGEAKLDQLLLKDSRLPSYEDVVSKVGGASPASLLDNGSSHVAEADQGSNGDSAEDVILEEPAGLNEVDEHARDTKVESAARSVVIDNGSSAPADVYSDEADGQIVSYTDEEGSEGEEEDDDDDGKELFDSAALTALLKAASGASSNGEITFTAPDGTRIFSVERPAGLGSSIPPLKPSAPRSARPNIFSPSDLSLTPEPEAVVDEEEKKLQEKVDQIKVKFLRLVHRLGHSPEDRVAAQVLYRLSLAEGIRRGRQMGRAFSLENAKKKALELEEEGREPLDFACNILLLGKTGVGKSATINSIFGEKKVPTSAFDASTTAVKEIVGTVDGVKVRVIDTPGLRPSVMDQAANRKILQSIKKYTKRYPPDIVLYVDRLDTQAWDFNDLPLLRSIAAAMGPSVWFNAIVALTHGASAPPDGSAGTPLSYEVYVDQRSRVVQHAIRQAAGDMRLMNPVALVENHPSCRRNREGQPILPNGLSWRSQLLLLCYSSKILSEANRVLKLQDSSPSQLFGFRSRSPPLPFLLSSLLQSKPHPKLGADQGESDLDVEDLSEDEVEEEGEEDEYDRLPPFKPLRKAQLAKLTKDQRRAYFDEYDYRVKLLQKKQWKEEIRRAKEMKKREKLGQETPFADDAAEDYDQDGGGAPATIPVPLPDMVLPPTFDSENPAYRYRFLEPSSQLLTRPVLDSHGWDHDCGYDGVSLEDNLALAGKFPASVSAQITKDKKDFTIHLDSSIAAKHGDNGSTLAGFDIQSVGKQLAYIIRSETKLKTLKKNRTAAGVSFTFLGENTAAGLKVEDELTVGKRLGVVASAGTMRSKGDAAYGANLEIRVRDREFPIGQDMSTLGLSLMRWRGDLALGANLQSQISIGRGSKVAARVGLNNKRSGQITLKLNSSEQLQIALMGVIPIAASIYRTIFSED